MLRRISFEPFIFSIAQFLRAGVSTKSDQAHAVGDLNGDTYYQLQLVLNDQTFPSTTNFFQIQIGGRSTFVADTHPVTAETDRTDLGSIPTAHVWTHYRFLVNLGGNCFGVRTDNGEVVDGGPSFTLPTTTTATISMGQIINAFEPPSGGTTFDFDNVVLSAFGPDAGDGG
jgi:hypothetical protein